MLVSFEEQVLLHVPLARSPARSHRHNYNIVLIEIIATIFSDIYSILLSAVCHGPMKMRLPLWACDRRDIHELFGPAAHKPHSASRRAARRYPWPDRELRSRG